MTSIWFWFLVFLMVGFGYVLRMVQVSVQEYRHDRQRGRVWDDSDWGGSMDPERDVTRIRAAFEEMMSADDTQSIPVVTVVGDGRYEARHARLEPLTARLFVHDGATTEQPLPTRAQRPFVRKAVFEEGEIVREHWSNQSQPDPRGPVRGARQTVIFGPQASPRSRSAPPRAQERVPLLGQ